MKYDQALVGSIKHWRKIVDGTDICRGSSNCPLCREYGGNRCIGCPVQKKTGVSCCLTTPYDAFIDFLGRQEIVDKKPSEIKDKKIRKMYTKLAAKELEFLTRLL